jgi:serine/threonine-protein phosphatase PGAM5
VTRFLYVIRHGAASPHDGPLSDVGQEQARLTGQRLREVPLTAIWHGPLPRAAQTAAIIAEDFPHLPVAASELAGDYIPSDPEPAELPPAYARFVGSYTPAERAQGAVLAAAAIERFTEAGGDDDIHELLVTHNFLIGCLVSHALDAPSWRWLGLNQMNCALTVLAYETSMPPRLISFNDAGHLPPALRWTGFPPAARPLSG